MIALKFNIRCSVYGSLRGQLQPVIVTRAIVLTCTLLLPFCVLKWAFHHCSSALESLPIPCLHLPLPPAFLLSSPDRVHQVHLLLAPHSPPRPPLRPHLPAVRRHCATGGHVVPRHPGLPALRQVRAPPCTSGHCLGCPCCMAASWRRTRGGVN